MDAATLNLLATDLATQQREIAAIFRKIHERVDGFETDAERRDSLGYQLHNLYCACEDLFQMIAEAFENQVAQGSSWHVELLARMLGVDFINLGFSGNAHCDLELAELMTEVDAACYVNDCVANMNVEWMNERYEKFNKILRTARPQTPLLLMSSFRWAAERYSAERRTNAAALNDVARTVAKHMQEEDDRVHFLDGSTLIGLDTDHPSVDGAHLTDLGFRRVADGLAPVLQEILG